MHYVKPSPDDKEATTVEQQQKKHSNKAAESI
jgi:hypothetical protein